MDDPRVVSFLDRQGEDSNEPSGLGGFDGVLALFQVRRERLAFDVRKGQKWPALVRSDIVNRTDIGVVKLRRDLCLAVEPLQEV